MMKITTCRYNPCKVLELTPTFHFDLNFSGIVSILRAQPFLFDKSYGNIILCNWLRHYAGNI